MAVSATDSSGATNYTYFNWTVTDFVPPPILTAPPTQTNSVNATVNALDASALPPPDGNNVASYSLSGQPSGIYINSSTGAISGTVASNAAGVYDVIETATSTTGAQAEVDFTWVVKNGGARADHNLTRQSNE